MSTPTVAGDTVWSECAALLRDDFASFAACCFRELNPRTRFATNWHVEVMTGKLAAVREGRIRRLLVSAAAAPSEVARGVWASGGARVRDGLLTTLLIRVLSIAMLLWWFRL
jgi:hypothetical protein